MAKRKTAGNPTTKPKAGRKWEASISTREIDTGNYMLIEYTLKDDSLVWNSPEWEAAEVALDDRVRRDIADAGNDLLDLTHGAELAPAIQHIQRFAQRVLRDLQRKTTAKAFARKPTAKSTHEGLKRLKQFAMVKAGIASGDIIEDWSNGLEWRLAKPVAKATAHFAAALENMRQQSERDAQNCVRPTPHEDARARDAAGTLRQISMVEKYLASGNLDRAVFHALCVGKLHERNAVRYSEPMTLIGRTSHAGAKKGGKGKKYTADRIAELSAKYQPLVDAVLQRDSQLTYTAATKRVARQCRVSERTIRNYTTNPTA